MRVAYCANVSESSGIGSLGLYEIKGCYMVVVVVYRDCGADPTCVLCVECFQHSIHRQHKYRVSNSLCVNEHYVDRCYSACIPGATQKLETGLGLIMRPFPGGSIMHYTPSVHLFILLSVPCLCHLLNVLIQHCADVLSKVNGTLPNIVLLFCRLQYSTTC